MKIPKKLKIAGFIWDVAENKEVTNEGGCYGSTHNNLQKIFLEPKMTIQKRDQVFLHEILHAVWNSYGLSYNKDFNHDKEELVVDALSNGLYQVLRDNNLLK